MVDAKRLVELEEENHALRNDLNTAQLKLRLSAPDHRQFVVLELSDGQTPKAAYGPFVGSGIASAFAASLRFLPGHDSATTFIQLNKEPLE